MVVVVAGVSCAAEPEGAPVAEAVPAATPEVAAEEAPVAGVVEVTASDYVFHLPDEFPSGWTTFEFVNRGKEPHFFLFTRLGDGHTFAEYAEQVGPAFGKAWEALKGGASKEEAGGILGAEVPAWYWTMPQTGGIGFVVPGETARTTMLLEPGTYIMECYIKTPEGLFHTELGMIRTVTVTTETTGMEPPEADIEIALFNDRMTVEGEFSAGRHTVAVRFEEHVQGQLGNDVHLAQLEADTDLATVVEWMDWMNIQGLVSPAPARFLGGTQEMPVGSTAYFEVDLEPGRYVWIAETGAARGLVEEFTVERAAY
jgi:hypothetical protein